MTSDIPLQQETLAAVGWQAGFRLLTVQSVHASPGKPQPDRTWVGVAAHLQTPLARPTASSGQDRAAAAVAMAAHPASMSALSSHSSAVGPSCPAGAPAPGMAHMDCLMESNMWKEANIWKECAHCCKPLQKSKFTCTDCSMKADLLCLR